MFRAKGFRTDSASGCISLSRLTTLSSQLTTVQRTYTQIFNVGEGSVQNVHLGSDSPVKRTHAFVSAISIGHPAPLTTRLPGHGTKHLTLSGIRPFSRLTWLCTRISAETCSSSARLTTSRG